MEEAKPIRNWIRYRLKKKGYKGKISISKFHSDIANDFLQITIVLIKDNNKIIMSFYSEYETLKKRISHIKRQFNKVYKKQTK